MTDTEQASNPLELAPSAVDDFANPLPRAILRQHSYLLLDGEWAFDLDPDDRGLEERWYVGHEYSGRAMWPGSIEEHLANAQADAQAQNTGRPWQDHVVAWYERTFSVPAQWQAPGRHIQLTFGAVSYETRVWLNGRPLRTVGDEETHYGAFTSFSYELRAEELEPVNRLTVRIAHSLDANIPRGKQESRVYRRGGIWYQTISGPVRSVWIEPVERNRLRSRLGVSSQIEDRMVEFEVTTRVRDAGEYRLRLNITAKGDDAAVAVEEFPLALEGGEKRQHVNVPMPGARLWSPAAPHLYVVSVQLVSPSGATSEIRTQFGLCKVEARSSAVFLNNEPLYLDGILYQPGRANFEQMRRHLLAIKALGCNLVRVHIAGIDPRIYALADELGLLLWVEVPSPHSSSQVSRANHWAELMRMLSLIGSHPSIILWSLYNEDWGAEDIATSAETRYYIRRAHDYLRLDHPELLVVDNDGWHHVSVEGRLMSDLLTAHVYTPDLDDWRQRLERLTAGEMRGVTAKPLVVGDPFFYRGQLPLVVSEWGGFGFADYGGPQDPHGRYQRIRAFKRELRRHAIGGDVYTQAVSIEEEVNGLIDFETGELLVPEGTLRSQPE